MAALEDHENFIREFLGKKESTFEELSEYLQATYPGVRGFSCRSIKRFCSERGIKRRGMVCDEGLDNAVGLAVSEV